MYSFTSSDRTTIQMDNLTNITSVKVTASISKNVTQKDKISSPDVCSERSNKTIENLDKQNYGLTYSEVWYQN